MFNIGIALDRMEVGSLRYLCVFNVSFSYTQCSLTPLLTHVEHDGRYPSHRVFVCRHGLQASLTFRRLRGRIIE